MKLRACACALLLAALCAPAAAHRLDEYLQSTTIRVTADAVSLHVRLVPGVEVAQDVWNSIDTDRSGTLSAAEQQAYARAVLADLALTIDGRDSGPAIVNWSFPSQADIRKGVGQISLGMHAQAPAADGPHHLRLVSRHRPAMSVYLVNTLLPADGTIRITGQQRNADQTRYDLDFTRSTAVPASAP
jgi:hypothetical protein